LVSHGPYRARQIDDVVAVGQQDLYAVTELAGTAEFVVFWSHLRANVSQHWRGLSAAGLAKKSRVGASRDQLVTPGCSIICGHLAAAVTVHWADRTLAQTTPVGAQWIVPGDEARRQDNPTQKITNDDYKYTVAAHPYGTSASSCTTAFGSPPDGEFTTRGMNSPGLGPASISSSMEQAITSPK
jgi:hypothetical protein